MVPTAEKRRACGGCRETEPVHHRARAGRHRGGREPAFGLQRPQGGLPHPVRRGGPPLLRQHRLRGREPASGRVEGEDQALPQPEPRPHVLLRVHRHASGLLPGSQELRRRLDRRAGKQEPHVQRGPAGLPALQRMGARAGGGHRPRRRAGGSGQRQPQGVPQRPVHHRPVQPRARASRVPPRTVHARADRPHQGGRMPAPEHGVRRHRGRAGGPGLRLVRPHVPRHEGVRLHGAALGGQRVARLRAHPVRASQLPARRQEGLRARAGARRSPEKALGGVREGWRAAITTSASTPPSRPSCKASRCPTPT